jgi:hypothetical protein
MQNTWDLYQIQWSRVSLDDEWIQTCLMDRRTCYFHSSKNFVDFYISFERFINCEFSKPLFTDILCFKRYKYVSTQKLTFLVQNMTLQKWLQWISNISKIKFRRNYKFWVSKKFINIGECNSRSKLKDMIYMSWCTIFVSKSS